MAEDLAGAASKRLREGALQSIPGAVNSNIRLAAPPGFVRFDGHYHGWLDNVLIGPGEDGPHPVSDGQVAEYLADSFVLGWNDADALAALLREHGETICAVIMEPVMVNTGGIEPL